MSPRKTTKKTAAKNATSNRARALIVGLTHVDPNQYDGWDGRSGCWGCDDDAANMRVLLEREGYAVTLLVDEKATRAAVWAGLKDAAAAAKPGDTFFFYYSGHGGRLPDQKKGRKGHDEMDGWDETLCLFDGQLRDDALNEIWVSFPKKSAIFIFSDSCHSGTNYRGLGRVNQPVDFVRDLNGDARMKASLLHISGCRDEEVSMGEENGGAFTTAVVAIWNKGRFGGTWDTFHDAVAAAVTTGQRPQGNLYGPDAEALSTRRPFAPLAASPVVSSSRSARRSAPQAMEDSEALALPTLESVALLATAAPRDGSAASPATSTLDELGKPGSKEFVRAVQENLCRHGVYDPGAIDGVPGPFTDWALGEFKIMAQTHDEPGVGPRTAAALLDADANKYFPLSASGSDLAARTIRLMNRNGHWICRHPDCVNIIYLEGVNPDGKINDDRPNVFNDLRLLITVENGKPVVKGIWEGTTEPGRHWTENPMDARGAARIAFGQYYAWSVGIHNDSHEALRQVLPVTVHRDLNKDYKRTGDQTFTGVFYINQHWGYDLPVSNLGNSLAGCLVGRTKNGHREFMNLIKADARAEASCGYKFTTAIMDGTLLEQSPV
jgi:hypothetical protein